MSDASTDFVAVLNNFTPASGSWLPLEALLAQLFQHPVSPTEVAAMLRVFERFPTDDGSGVFWSIVHGLEAISGYEPFLVDSVQRVPSDFGVIMLGRILNTGQREIAGTSVVALLAAVQSSPYASHTAKRHAHNFQSRNV